MASHTISQTVVADAMDKDQKYGTFIRDGSQAA